MTKIASFLITALLLSAASAAPVDVYAHADRNGAKVEVQRGQGYGHATPTAGLKNYGQEVKDKVHQVVHAVKSKATASPLPIPALKNHGQQIKEKIQSLKSGVIYTTPLATPTVTVPNVKLYPIKPTTSLYIRIPLKTPTGTPSLPTVPALPTGAPVVKLPLPTGAPKNLPYVPTIKKPYVPSSLPTLPTGAPIVKLPLPTGAPLPSVPTIKKPYVPTLPTGAIKKVPITLPVAVPTTTPDVTLPQKIEKPALPTVTPVYTPTVRVPKVAVPTGVYTKKVPAVKVYGAVEAGVEFEN
ncbi:hypothetical protein HK104_008904 [Borealophlyctis nickersoniae]|nr:hypothetical protein HK104_008904 [Borealophlyctis nickersoniae]